MLSSCLIWQALGESATGALLADSALRSDAFEVEAPPQSMGREVAPAVES